MNERLLDMRVLNLEFGTGFPASLEQWLGGEAIQERVFGDIPEFLAEIADGFNIVLFTGIGFFQDSFSGSAINS